jgi:hypothetical protein
MARNRAMPTPPRPATLADLVDVVAWERSEPGNRALSLRNRPGQVRTLANPLQPRDGPLGPANDRSGNRCAAAGTPRRPPTGRLDGRASIGVASIGIVHGLLVGGRSCSASRRAGVVGGPLGRRAGDRVARLQSPLNGLLVGRQEDRPAARRSATTRTTRWGRASKWPWLSGPGSAAVLRLCANCCLGRMVRLQVVAAANGAGG